MRHMFSKSIHLNRIIQLIICIYSGFSLFDFFFIGNVGSISKYIVVLIIAVCLINYPHIRVDNLITPMFVWVLIACISLLWTKGTANGVDIILGFGMNVLLLTFVYNLDWDDKTFSLFRRCLFIAGIGLMLLATFGSSTFRYSTRVNITLLGRSMDPNKIVYLILPVLLISIDNVNGTLFKRISFIAVSLYWFYVALSTGSRSGVVAGIGLVLAYFFCRFKQAKHRKFIVIGFIIFLVVLFNFENIISMFGSEIALRFGISTFTEGDTRIKIWTNALTTYWNINPVLGLGIGSYRAIYGQEVHNVILQTFVETGPIGFFFFCLIFFVRIHDSYKNGRYDSFALVISIIIAIFFLNGYSEKFLWNVFLYDAISYKNSIWKIENHT